MRYASITNATEEITPAPPTPIISTYTYTLNFNGNHADVTGVPAAMTIESDNESEVLQIPATNKGIPILENRAFIGWIETPAYSAGQKIYLH